ncbi:hypothetical protein Tco_1223564 [Tanacetum coccineum]
MHSNAKSSLSKLLLIILSQHSVPAFSYSISSSRASSSSESLSERGKGETRGISIASSLDSRLFILGSLGWLAKLLTNCSILSRRESTKFEIISSSWSYWSIRARSAADRTRRLLVGGRFAFSMMKNGITSEWVCKCGLGDCKMDEKKESWKSEGQLDLLWTTLKELIDSEDRLIHEILVDDVPRVAAQRALRVQRASMQD